MNSTWPHLPKIEPITTRLAEVKSPGIATAELDIDAHRRDPRDPMSEDYLDVLELRISGARIPLTTAEEALFQEALCSVWKRLRRDEH